MTVINLVLCLLILLLLFLVYRQGQENKMMKRNLLLERDWLHKEIHHRVKNNLQIAMSLLNTQSYYLENEMALAAIHQSRNRMYAMSLIHQRVYQTGNLETIDMSHYVPELVDYIREGIPGKVYLYFDIRVDAVRLDVSQAVPVGLIINEVVTNSISHAFPDRQEGTIRIVLQELSRDHIQLVLSDDGVGLGDDFDLQRTRSMGMRLVYILNEQLEGDILMENTPGLTFSIRFDREVEQRRPFDAPSLGKFG